MRNPIAIALMLMSICPATRAEAEDWCRMPLERQLRSAGACKALGAAMDEMVASFSQFGFTGTVLVGNREGLIIHQAYGLQDRDAGTANSISTRFPWLSVTKTLVATALLRQSDQGKLDLDAPLSRYFGDFPPDKETATTHHLLTHTGGLIEEGFSTRSADRDEFVANVKAAPMESVPGERWRYSNAGSSLAAAVLEVSVGKPWDAALDALVFEPAGMDSSAVLRGIFPDDVAAGHFGRGQGERTMRFSDSPPYVFDLWWGAAGATGVVAPVADIYRWLLALDGGELVSAANRTRMVTAHVQDHGYGWHVDTHLGHRRLWKGGGAPMYETQVAWYPDDGLFVIIAMNDHEGRRVPVWSALEAALFEGTVTTLPQIKGFADVLPAGEILTAEGEVVAVIMDAGQAVLTAPDSDAYPKGPIPLYRGESGDFFGIGFDPGTRAGVLIELTQPTDGIKMTAGQLPLRSGDFAVGDASKLR